jgi:hypothetical protein
MDLNTIRALVVGKAPKQNTGTHTRMHARTHSLPPSLPCCLFCVRFQSWTTFSGARTRGWGGGGYSPTTLHPWWFHAPQESSMCGCRIQSSSSQEERKEAAAAAGGHEFEWVDGLGWLHFPSSMREQWQSLLLSCIKPTHPPYPLTHPLTSLGPRPAQINHLGFFFWNSIFF